ncbi:MAG: hypothetical protein JHC74_14740 [Thermoleophilia bacterium]|nr:hypothetical protein [Thermoleophilia bacterium]
MSLVIAVLWMLLSVFGVSSSSSTSSSTGGGWSPAPTESVQAAPAAPVPAVEAPTP